MADIFEVTSAFSPLAKVIFWTGMASMLATGIWIFARACAQGLLFLLFWLVVPLIPMCVLLYRDKNSRYAFGFYFLSILVTISTVFVDIRDREAKGQLAETGGPAAATAASENRKLTPLEIEDRAYMAALRKKEADELARMSAPPAPAAAAAVGTAPAGTAAPTATATAAAATPVTGKAKATPAPAKQGSGKAKTTTAKTTPAKTASTKETKKKPAESSAALVER